MADGTGIEWTDATWNPVTGCTKVSPGCDHCYAETFAERWRGTPGHYFENGFDVQLRPDKLDLPLRWTRPRQVFVNSMSDLFHDAVPDRYVAQVFAVMALAEQHTFQLLTKRHARMRSLLNSPAFRVAVLDAAYLLVCGEVDAASVPAKVANEYHARRAAAVRGEVDSALPGWPLPNVWLGVSVESQQWADIRVPVLLDTLAAVRWLSCEPLLGPLDLHWCAGVDALERDWIGSPGAGTGAPHPLLDWVVVGGESGPGARPMHLDWAQKLRDDCTAAAVPFFFKQWGNWVPPSQMTPDALMSWDVEHGTSAYDHDQPWRIGKKNAGRQLDGRTWDQYPKAVTADA